MAFHASPKVNFTCTNPGNGGYKTIPIKHHQRYTSDLIPSNAGTTTESQTCYFRAALSGSLHDRTVCNVQILK